MKNLALFVTILFATNLAFGQTKPKASVKQETSDPEAKSLLDKTRKKYEGFKSLEIDFSLQIELPGQATTTQKGKFKSEGDSKYRLEMPDQTIISDGTTTWIYLPKNNEVQINNADPKSEQSLISPKEFMKIYQKGDYLFAIVDETDGTQIEFKPVNRKSDYSKLRLSLDKKNLQIQSIKAFAKDGGRYTFSVSKQTANKSFDASTFGWDKAKNPNVKVEDLRM